MKENGSKEQNSTAIFFIGSPAKEKADNVGSQEVDLIRLADDHSCTIQTTPSPTSRFSLFTSKLIINQD